MSTGFIEGFQLSPQQRRVWAMQGAGPAFCCQGVVSITGELDGERLRAALQSVVDEHEILRTSFHRLAGLSYPIQVIAAGQPIRLSQHRSPARDDEQRAAEVSARLAELRRAVTLGPGPTLQAALLTFAQRQHALLLSLPALCGDGETLRQLVCELSRSYAGAGRAAAALQYADAAEALNRLLDAEETAAGRAYWREKNLAAPSALRLPCERLRDAPGLFEPRTLNCNLPAAWPAQLSTLAARYEGTPAGFLLACLHAMLWRLTGQPEVSVGVACDGRNYDELKGALGLFVKYVPVQSRCASDRPFSTVWAQVEQAMREGAARQEYFSWEQDAGLEPQVAETPFFPMCFESVEPAATYLVDDTRFALAAQEVCFDRYKVQFACVADDDHLAVRLSYDPDVVQAEDARRLADGFEQLLASALAAPERPLGELNMLSAAERRQLLHEWPRVEPAGAPAACLAQLFEMQAERTPAAAAVVCEGEQLTYGELNRWADRVAQQLRRAGVGPEELVGLYLERSVGVIVALLGVLKAGGAYAPLDLESPKARLSRQVESLKPRVLVTQTHLLAALPDYAGAVLCLDRDCPRGETADALSLAPAADPENLAYVIFTSGSTGAPKGVAVTHRSLVNYTRAISARLKLAADGAGRPLNFACVSTLSADLGNTVIFPALVSGGCLHVLSQAVATDAAQFRAYLKDHEIDVLKIVPSHLSALLAADGSGVLPRRYLILGGEKLTTPLVSRIAELANGCEVINHYGPTETTVGSLTFTPAPSAPRYDTPTVPIGRPLANTEVYVLDRRLEPVPIGAPGELYIGGQGLARGYLRLPALTAERMIPHPFANGGGERLYRTGDLVRYLPDGAIEFLGRVDQQVKVRGFRVEPGEVEAVLGRHPAVRDVAVLAREATPGDVRLVAYVVARDERANLVEELRSYAQQALPGYMLPAAFMPLPHLPLTPNGKLDRHALPEPTRPQSAPATEPARPLSKSEKTLAEIWAEVLRVEQVGPHDDFFALGGDSILSIQIAAKAHAANLRITPLQIFEFPTIAELVAIAERAGEVEPGQEASPDLVPLTPIQSMFFERDLPDAQHWNLSALLRLKQPFAPAVLAQAVQILLERHDALRLRFRRVGQAWQQTVVESGGDGSFSRIDLSSLPPAEQGRALEAQAAALQTSLDLQAGPLLRVALFDLGAGQAARLLIVIHHLAVDIFSWRVLLTDLHAACEQLNRGAAAVELAAPTTSFRAWARRLAAYARSGGAHDEQSYWLDMAREGAPSLAVDFPMGLNSTASARVISVSLPEEETLGLHAVLKDYRVRMNELLLTALTRALTRRQPVRSLLVDLEGHGRETLFPEVDLSRTVGWFTAIFPMLLSVSADDEPTAALQAVRRQLRGVPNGGIGYGLLRHLSGDEELAARLRALPAPEVSFNYLGRLDRVLPESALFALADESAGTNQSPQGLRPHLLEISARITAGRLQMDWAYSENCHRSETVRRFADDCLDELLALMSAPASRQP